MVITIKLDLVLEYIPKEFIYWYIDKITITGKHSQGLKYNLKAHDSVKEIVLFFTCQILTWLVPVHQVLLYHGAIYE